MNFEETFILDSNLTTIKEENVIKQSNSNKRKGDSIKCTEKRVCESPENSTTFSLNPHLPEESSEIRLITNNTSNSPSTSMDHERSNPQSSSVLSYSQSMLNDQKSILEITKDIIDEFETMDHDQTSVSKEEPLSAALIDEFENHSMDFEPKPCLKTPSFTEELIDEFVNQSMVYDQKLI